MKDREKQILEYIIEHNQVLSSQLMDTFQISKRTLYYDIESINYYIRNCGQIKNIHRRFSYVGNYHTLQDIMNNVSDQFTSMEVRKNFILYKILNGEHVTLEKLADMMHISKNTVVQTMDEIKQDLKKNNLTLVSKPQYNIHGDENMIRNYFIILMQEDNNILNTNCDEVLIFDQKHKLHLTDYSLATLSKFIEFVNRRIQNGNFISMMEEKVEIEQFPFYEESKELLIKNDELEALYLSAYISSLPSLCYSEEREDINRYIDILIDRFEATSAITLESKDEFIKNIKRHLLSSYYRIKFHFPISNPTLDEIKRKHETLFMIIKRILENEDDFPSFKGIREEEIGFIAAYFGGYLKGSSANVRKNHVLLVCPNGLMVSKSLEVQLYKYIPTIDIVGIIALKDLKTYLGSYSYIISTIDIPDYENVIIVNPLLTKLDIDTLMEKLLDISFNFQHIDVDVILSSIKQHADIKDEEKLRKELESIIYRRKEKELYQPMLKELLNENRIVTIDHVDDWKKAITIAADPLLKDGSIEMEYVDQMIESVEKHGPYIVLADHFALPHASSASGVNKLSMSLLIVKDEVDLMGKPVNLFMVLATIDNTSHMKALASLTEILYDEKNMALFCEGNKQQILDLIQGSN